MDLFYNFQKNCIQDTFQTNLIISWTEKANPFTRPACSLYTTLLMKRFIQHLLLISDIKRTMPINTRKVHSSFSLVIKKFIWKKCPNTKFFWSVLFHILIEDGQLCLWGRCTNDVHEHWPIFKTPDPLVQLCPTFFHLVELGRPISNEPPSLSKLNQSIKRKHNPRMTIACYQVFPSGRLLFLVSTH